MWYYSKTHLPIGTAQEYFQAWTVLYIIKHKVCVWFLFNSILFFIYSANIKKLQSKRPNHCLFAFYPQVHFHGCYRPAQGQKEITRETRSVSEVWTLLTVANTKHKTTKLEQCVGKQPVHLSLLTLRLCRTNRVSRGVRQGGNWHIVLLLTAAPALIRHTIGSLLSPELQGSQSSASPGPQELPY